jgi:hypothetical protein
MMIFYLFLQKQQIEMYHGCLAFHFISSPAPLYLTSCGWLSFGWL